MSKKYCRAIVKFSELITCFQNRKRRALTKALTAETMHVDWQVELDDQQFYFHCPSSGALSAAQAFDNQEPETRAWLRDYVSEKDVVWDIGANVGLYSLYAAKICSAKVYCFEPNAGTFSVLVSNIMNNSCSDRIYPVQIALSDKNGMVNLNLWRKGAGHALSAIGEPENILGKFEPEGVYKCLAMTPETVASILNIDQPDHIKIDVDGHELSILSAAGNILNSVKSVCIELEPTVPEENQKIRDLLETRGLREIVLSGALQRNSIFLRQ